MTAEQEAIERLRADVEMWPPWAEEGLVSIADLRALIDSHERMRLALVDMPCSCPEWIQIGHDHNCATQIARAALEGNNE